MAIKKNTLYLCEPSKNKECKKVTCQHICRHTRKKDCAKLDQNGMPIIVPQSEI